METRTKNRRPSKLKTQPDFATTSPEYLFPRKSINIHIYVEQEHFSSIAMAANRSKAPKSSNKNSKDANTVLDNATIPPIVQKGGHAPSRSQKRSATIMESAQAESSTTQPKKKSTTATKKQRTDDVDIGAEEIDQHLSHSPPPAPTQQRSVRPRSTTQNSTTRRKRRTKEEILADKAQAEADKRRDDELKRQKEYMMEKMDIDEGVDRAKASSQVVRKFADIENEDSGEEFVGYNEVEGSDSTDDLAEVGVIQKNVREKPVRLGKEQSGGGQTKEMGGKKTSKTVTFASGLRSNWDSEERETRNLRPVEKKKYVEISAGGLDNSDIEDVNPFQTVGSTDNSHSPTGQRDSSRQNNLVLTVQSDEDEFIPPPAAKIPTNYKKKQVPIRGLKSSDKHLTRSGPTLTEKANIKTKKIRSLNTNNVRMSDLPDFATEKWRSTFLPTLYAKFFMSDHPFDGFAKGSDRFLALLQNTLEEVYPDVDYTVTSSCSIQFLACNRVNEKRSAIGSSALETITKHLKKFKDAQAAKDWLRWARRIDGPLFFQTPSPMNSPTSPMDPEYQFPSGRLLSQFIIDIATQFLSLSAGSVTDNGFPKGLVALIMAALERAVKYHSMPSSNVLEFSKQFWGSQVTIYYKSFEGENGVPDSRWKELVNICVGDHSQSGDGSFQADLSILDHNRPFVFGFRSPEKPL